MLRPYSHHLLRALCPLSNHLCNPVDSRPTDRRCSPHSNHLWYQVFIPLFSLHVNHLFNHQSVPVSSPALSRREHPLYNPLRIHLIFLPCSRPWTHQLNPRVYRLWYHLLNPTASPPVSRRSSPLADLPLNHLDYPRHSHPSNLQCNRRASHQNNHLPYQVVSPANNQLLNLALGHLPDHLYSHLHSHPCSHLRSHPWYPAVSPTVSRPFILLNNPLTNQHPCHRCSHIRCLQANPLLSLQLSLLYSLQNNHLVIPVH